MKPLFRSKGSYNCRIIATDPLVYFPLDEVSGSVAKNWGSLGAAANGSYTGVDLHSAPGPKGGGAPYFDGVNDYVNMYSTPLRDAFDPDAGSMMVWAKVDAAAWADGTYRCFIHLGSPSVADYIRVLKMTAANGIQFVYQANSSANVINTYSNTEIVFFQVVITWDTSADVVSSYKNGAAWGTPSSGLDVWTANLNAAYCLVGAQTTTPALPFKGYLAHAAVWDRVLTPAEILSLYQ